MTSRIDASRFCSFSELERFGIDSITSDTPPPSPRPRANTAPNPMVDRDEYQQYRDELEEYKKRFRKSPEETFETESFVLIRIPKIINSLLSPAPAESTHENPLLSLDPEGSPHSISPPIGIA